MPKLFVIMGKSATGKDSIYKLLLKQQNLQLKKIVSYTTRPIRQGETDGREYYFVDNSYLNQLQQEDKIIEQRSYNTIHGIWNYFTVNDGQILLNQYNYLMIGTLEAYGQLREYYGADKVLPIYIEVEDGIRLSRALARELNQMKPRYAEMCRRYLADDSDFADVKLESLGITKRYMNIDINLCIQQVSDDIKIIMEKY